MCLIKSTLMVKPMLYFVEQIGQISIEIDFFRYHILNLASISITEQLQSQKSYCPPLREWPSWKRDICRNVTRQWILPYCRKLQQLQFDRLVAAPVQYIRSWDSKIAKLYWRTVGFRNVWRFQPTYSFHRFIGTQMATKMNLRLYSYVNILAFNKEIYSRVHNWVLISAKIKRTMNGWNLTLQCQARH